MAIPDTGVLEMMDHIMRQAREQGLSPEDLEDPAAVLRFVMGNMQGAPASMPQSPPRGPILPPPEEREDLKDPTQGGWNAPRLALATEAFMCDMRNSRQTPARCKWVNNAHPIADHIVKTVLDSPRLFVRLFVLGPAEAKRFVQHLWDERSFETFAGLFETPLARYRQQWLRSMNPREPTSFDPPVRLARFPREPALVDYQVALDFLLTCLNHFAPVAHLREYTGVDRPPGDWEGFQSMSPPRPLVDAVRRCSSLVWSPDALDLVEGPATQNSRDLETYAHKFLKDEMAGRIFTQIGITDAPEIARAWEPFRDRRLLYLQRRPGDAAGRRLWLEGYTPEMAKGAKWHFSFDFLNAEMARVPAEFPDSIHGPSRNEFPVWTIEDFRIEKFFKKHFLGADKPAPSAAHKRCDACQKPAKRLKACGRCRKTHYCSVECQKSAWGEHKLVCEPS
jgi:MYND finger